MPTPEKTKRVALGRPWLEPAAAGLEAPQLLCNLKKTLSCCGGKGYQITVKHALAHAETCKCLKECPSCFGRARQMAGNDSKSCKIPAPNTVANLINSAMIPARYAEAELSKFSNFSGNGKDVLERIQRWKTGFKATRSMGFVIEGAVGVGKTYMLAALAKEFAERGMSVKFTDFFQLLGILKAGFSEGKADSTQLSPLIHVDVLFVDELGKGRNNEFEMTILDQLITGRYNQNKTIIATTNYKLDNRDGKRQNAQRDLESYQASGNEFNTGSFDSLENRIGPRMFSRLKEMCHFEKLTGEDFRSRDLYR